MAKMIEASLILSSFSATHFLYLKGNKMVDEGIKVGAKELVTFEYFEAKHQKDYWIIDQVI